MFAAFKTVRQLHEMLWYLAEARTRTYDPDTVTAVLALRNTILEAMQELPQLLVLDVPDLHSRVRLTLMDISEEVRSAYRAAGTGHLGAEMRPGADLMGRNLSARQLSGADLRGAYLIAADLRGSNLSGADLLGADFRDARLEGADLSQALFLTQPQLNAARGSAATALPPDLVMPAHWLDG
ncbi:pentapeptide repeat-containing protein [Arthrobacter sp. NPDC097144]|uniref:pentapeptide repeat-containing protein n=1 Tax=Arthrobacter sp. NPDC097144 TaxID=3363946 RepID=UPI0037F4A8B3